jgi:DNA-binding beta-propeller fold protein YncE
MAAKAKPLHILRAPKNLLAAAEPQQNGTMWVLAGNSASRGLFQLDPSNGNVLGSTSVSDAAQSVAETSSGVLGLAIGTRQAGALELMDSHTGKVTRTLTLPAPAQQVVTGSDGSTLYVLTDQRSVASVSIVDAESGRVTGTIPVPKDAVSVVPNLQQTALYALGGNGLVSRIAIAGGKVTDEFKIGVSGNSLALSPDGTTMYALKDADTGPNIAVVNMTTESVLRAQAAPTGARQVLVSGDGHQLYDVVGTPAYGNIQVFRA